jgi:hypothetical protein
MRNFHAIAVSVRLSKVVRNGGDQKGTFKDGCSCFRAPAC